MAKMRKALVLVSLLALALPAIGSIGTAPAIAGDDDKFTARLSGYQVVPSISTTGRGHFRAKLTTPATLSFELQYSNLEAPALAPTSAELHFAQRGVNGGLIAVLCGPGAIAPNPVVCPPQPATLTGTITAAHVLGPAGQGIAAGEFAELLKAMQADAVYVVVSTATYPGGEIRGQVDD